MVGHGGDDQSHPAELSRIGSQAMADALMRVDELQLLDPVNP